MNTKSFALACLLFAPLSGYCAQPVVDMLAGHNAEITQAQQDEQIKQLENIHADLQKNNELLGALLQATIHSGELAQQAKK